MHAEVQKNLAEIQHHYTRHDILAPSSLLLSILRLCLAVVALLWSGKSTMLLLLLWHDWPGLGALCFFGLSLTTAARLAEMQYLRTRIEALRQNLRAGSALLRPPPVRQIGEKGSTGRELRGSMSPVSQAPKPHASSSPDEALGARIEQIDRYLTTQQRLLRLYLGWLPCLGGVLLLSWSGAHTLLFVLGDNKLLGALLFLVQALVFNGRQLAGLYLGTQMRAMLQDFQTEVEEQSSPE